jgi:hypothetical protein
MNNLTYEIYNIIEMNAYQSLPEYIRLSNLYKTNRVNILDISNFMNPVFYTLKEII